MHIPEEKYMDQCLQLAIKGAGNTYPNPLVGAVLVYNNKIIGEGWHQHYGGPHAEVNCLANVADENKHLIPESTMYVNLEPCAHYGITPPCAQLLVEQQVKQVVIAVQDPFPQVSGSGIEILRNADINVTIGTGAAAAMWVNRRFLTAHTLHRPYIILKWAQSADGYFATSTGAKTQISSIEAQRMVHQWRTEEAAIMVGYLTALNDNPQLTTRLHPGRQPLRIALDRNATLPHTHHLFNAEAATWIITERESSVLGNVHYINMPFNAALMHNIMQRLQEARILSVIIEGGAQLLNTFIQEGLWDEARVFSSSTLLLHEGIDAPQLIGATPAFEKKVGTDTLYVSTNSSTNYPYPASYAGAEALL